MGDKLDIAVDKIAKKRELPTEVKNAINSKIFKNIIMAIIFVNILIVINVMYTSSIETAFVSVTKGIGFATILGVVIIFEAAYRKDDSELIANGIEAIVLSVFIMYIPYVYLLVNSETRMWLMLMPVCFVIYYIFKCIIIKSRIKREYLNSLSDVKEILQEEETGYLEEDSKKILKERKLKNTTKKGGK